MKGYVSLICFLSLGSRLIAADCNGNTTEDAADVAGGTSQDCNKTGIPDECELVAADCNGNGIPDACDLASGSSLDCNENGLPDDCDLRTVIRFGAPTTYAVDVSPFSIPPIDLDGDRDLDLVTANRGAGYLSVFINLGARKFAAPVTYGTGVNPHHIAPADYN